MKIKISKDVIGLFQAVLLLYGPVTARDDISELSLADLFNLQVTTASKKSENVKDAPGIVRIITREELRQFGKQTIFEALDMAANIYPTSSFEKIRELTAVRGLATDHRNRNVLLLLNGHPVRSSQQGGVEENFLNAFPIEAVDRIEYIRGPGSVLYGTNAFSGVINVLTKKDHSMAGAGIQGGNPQAFKANLNGGYTGENFRLAAYGTYSDAQEIPYAMNTRAPYTGINGSIDSTIFKTDLGLFLDGGYNVGPFKFKLDGFFSKIRQRGFYVDIYEEAFRPDSITRIIGIFETEYSPIDPLSIHASVTYGSREEVRNMVLGIHPLGTIQGVGTVTEQDVLYESYTAYNIPIDNPVFSNANLLLGGSALNFWGKDTVPHADLPGSTGMVDRMLNPVKHYNKWWFNGYLQGDVSFSFPLKLILGGQVNKAEDNPADFVPRGGIVYNPLEFLGMKFLVANAYRAPSPLETDLEVSTLKGNPDLESEKILTYDFQVFTSFKKAFAALTGYYSTIDNVVTRVPGSGNQMTYINKDELKSYGAEFEGKYNPIEQLRILGNAGYAQVEDEDGESGVTFMPRLSVKAGLIWKIMPYLSTSIFGSYYADIKKVEEVVSTVQVVNDDPTDIIWLTAQINYSLTKMLQIENYSVEMYVKGTNLLNQKVYTPDFVKRAVNTIQSLDRGPLSIEGGVRFEF